MLESKTLKNNLWTMLKRINKKVYIWVKIEKVNSILLQFIKYMYTHIFSYKNVYLFTNLLS